MDFLFVQFHSTIKRLFLILLLILILLGMGPIS